MFVNREELIAAFGAWKRDKSKPIGRSLVERGALTEERHRLIEELVNAHLSTEVEVRDADGALETIETVGPGLFAGPRKNNEVVTLSEGLGLSLTRPIGAEQQAASRTAPFELGAFNARYHILRRHAEGGLGVVSIARDNELDREVAYKEIKARHADDPISRERFVIEAEVTGKLEHPGIIPVYGLGRDPSGRPYYAMRFIEGESLDEAIKRLRSESSKLDPSACALRFRELVDRFVNVCNALAYAHSRGVIHRDIKPSNVMLGPFGETLVVDWGLAKATGRVEPTLAIGEGRALRTRSSAESGAALRDVGGKRRRHAQLHESRASRRRSRGDRHGERRL